MNELVLERLYEAMEILIEQHINLSEMSEQKKQAIIRNDVNLLIELTTRESRLVKLISKTEEQRIAAVTDYCVESGLGTGAAATVSTIIRLIPNAHDKAKLIDLSQRLNELLTKLKALNEGNMKLLRYAAEFNEFSLHLLAGTDAQDYVYTRPDAQTGYGNGARAFDYRT
ncbi:flagellar protein FlgN [Cohnella sp. AR92]|uniref:flagellar protein FlgN n=1 Tax=Cohnella sp. AR92 TaxID=648716 RepID=UPI0013159D94|nr:flagellar protein FlgN [Cohnella sp. AR92]